MSRFSKMTINVSEVLQLAKGYKPLPLIVFLLYRKKRSQEHLFFWQMLINSNWHRLTHKIIVTFIIQINHLTQTWPNCGPLAAFGPPKNFCGPSVDLFVEHYTFAEKNTLNWHNFSPKRKKISQKFSVQFLFYFSIFPVSKIKFGYIQLIC
jgi:hypothetical protein